MIGYYHNSTIRIKPGTSKLKRKPIKRSLRPMKRGELKRVPGTARTTFKPKRESPRLIRFRREVRQRDNYTCQFPGCGSRSKRIDVHHIAKRSQRPDLKFTVSNGICLCRKHHDWTDTHHDEAVRIGLLNTESYELAKKQERKAA
jgi:hypothetical protein